MLANELLLDGLSRIKETVHEVTEGLSLDDLTMRPAETGNSIAWLIWHIARGQDATLAGLNGGEQIWNQAWLDRMGLPFDLDATGYGQSSEDVSAIRAEAKDLLEYFDAAHDATVSFVKQLTEADYAKVVDASYDPPVTMAVRLVSIVDDNIQHAGQAAYVRGLLGK